jgi:hypothetical protein
VTAMCQRLAAGRTGVGRSAAMPLTACWDVTWKGFRKIRIVFGCWLGVLSATCWVVSHV